MFELDVLNIIGFFRLVQSFSVFLEKTIVRTITSHHFIREY